MRILFLVLALGGCAQNVGPPFTISTSHGSLFGQEDLLLSGDLSSLGTVSTVTIGGVNAYGLRTLDDGLHVVTQGLSQAQSVDIEIVGNDGRALRRGLFRYDPPVAGLANDWIAFGASLTQGTQGGGIDTHSQLHGVSAVIARQAGVWLALPLFADGLVTPLAPTDFNLDCTRKPNTGVTIEHIVTALTDPATNDLDIRRGRIDSALPPRNVAVGGSKLSDLLGGGSGQVAVLENLVELPDGQPDGLLNPPSLTQLERIEKADAQIGFAADLLANDLDGAVVQSNDLALDLVTPLPTVQAELAMIAARLGKLHGQYFIATMFRLTSLPGVVALGRRRIAAGTDTADSWAAKLQSLDDSVDADNGALLSALAPYPNLHVVDVGPIFTRLVAMGVDVGGQHLTLAQFGGLLSLDNLHFSDTGYALYANVFIDALNQALGSSIPEVDPAAVEINDPYSASTLSAAGFVCANQ